MLEIGEDKLVFEVVPTHTFKVAYHQLFFRSGKMFGNDEWRSIGRKLALVLVLSRWAWIEVSPAGVFALLPWCFSFSSVLIFVARSRVKKMFGAVWKSSSLDPPLAHF